MSDAEDFEEQLRQEAIQKAKEEDQGSRTYKDKDGMEYEWDAQKQAWFPKIDEDFIARYQMNYGTTASTEADTTATTSETTKSATQPAPSQPIPEYGTEAYRQYYNYYYNSCYVTAGQTGDSTTTTASTEGGKALSSPGTAESQDLPERTEEYIEYCKEYYKFYHGTSNDDEGFDYCQYYEYYSQYGYDQAEEGEDKDSAKAGSSDKSKENGGDKAGEKRKREEATWFEMDQQKNTNVYVSGLPAEMTEAEFIEFMGKCGMVMHDPFTRKPKIKLYKDEAGKNKGDGRCCYIKVESVELALKILDGSELQGQTVHVEKANFAMKGDYDPKLRKKLSNRQKKKLKLQQQKLFDWRPDTLPGERKKSDKVVVLKNVFNPVDFEKDPATIQEIRSDIRLECSKFGEVRKVTVYDRHADGIATVAFKEPEEADVCIEALNGRWFGGRQLSTETWDGKTKFDVKESELEREARLRKWEKFLETGEGTAPGGTSTGKTEEKGSDVKEKDVETVKKAETGDAKKETDAKDDAVEIEQDKRPMEVDESAAAASS